MLRLVKSLARSAGVDTRRLYHAVSAASVNAAIREQGLAGLRQRLRETVPNLKDQYTVAIDSTEYERYWEIKMRSNHAFQIDSTLKALDRIGGAGLTVVDVGDSSGNHGAYLNAVAPAGRIAKMVSVNLDPVAVDKIRAKGGEAILCRAEELDAAGLRPNLMLMFETLEHMTDPLRFLHAMAAAETPNILFTVPYRTRSRFGGDLIRRTDADLPREITPEQVHILELSPGDWKLLARLAGYRTVFCRIYRQYPRRSPLGLTKPMWRKVDFEGFIAVLLERDSALSSRYTGWRAPRRTSRSRPTAG